MAIVDLASYPLAIAKAGVVWGQRRNDAESISDATGATQVRLYGNPRWALALNSPDAVTEAEAIVWRELKLALRGRVNVLKAWNPAQTIIRGTMRGTMTLNASASAGATSLQITAGAGQASTTILSGSPLTIGTGLGTSQLVHTLGNATANGSGVITVTVEPPLRLAFSGGAAVTYDKAFAYFRDQAGAAQWRHYGTNLHQEFSLDLVEVFN